MATGTATDPFIKDPDASEWDVQMDWSAWLNDGESLSTSSFAVTSHWTDIVIDSDTNDATSATAYMSGGTDGRYYKITNSITTDASPSRNEDKSFWVRCIDQ